MRYNTPRRQSEDNELERKRQYDLWKRARPFEYEEKRNVHGNPFSWFVRNRYIAPPPAAHRPKPPEQNHEPANGMSRHQAFQHDIFMCKNAGGAQLAAHRAAAAKVHTPCPHCSMEIHDPAQGCSAACVFS